MTQTATRYGGALYELAAEEGLAERILTELEQAARLLDENPAYLRLLSTPSLPHAERAGLLDEAFGAACHPYLVNFLKLLCDEGLLRELNGCRAAYRARYNRDHDILEVKAAAAVPLSAEQQSRLAGRLAELTGKTIDLSVAVEPGLLGGIRLDLDGRRLDGTAKRRLELLRAGLEAATL